MRLAHGFFVVGKKYAENFKMRFEAVGFPTESAALTYVERRNLSLAEWGDDNEAMKKEIVSALRKKGVSAAKNGKNVLLVDKMYLSRPRENAVRGLLRKLLGVSPGGVYEI